MFKHKSLWVIGALALIGGVTLVGCSRERSVEYGGGRGAGRAYEADQGLAERGQGRGRQGLSESGPVEGLVAGAQAGNGRGGARNAAPASIAEERGEVLTLSGTLDDRNGEWYLRTDNGSYLLGLGPSSYRDAAGISLVEGAAAEVRGQLTDDGEIAVLTCATGGELYAFRTEDGVPMWSGRYRNGAVAGGDGQAAGTERGGRRGGGGGRGGRA